MVRSLGLPGYLPTWRPNRVKAGLPALLPALLPVNQVGNLALRVDVQSISPNRLMTLMTRATTPARHKHQRQHWPTGCGCAVVLSEAGSTNPVNVGALTVVGAP